MSGGGSAQKGAGAPLVGRDRDIEFIRSFVNQAAIGGGALLVSGEIGVGKTVLLEAAASYAAAARMRVLRAAGAEFEASVSFAALHQLLIPVFDELPQLSAVQGRALSVAVGLSDGPPPDQLIVSNAALTLLVRAGAARPSLVIVDDLPWVDRSSAVVLGFVARRLTGSRVGFLAASRSGEESFFEQGDLPGYELQPLDDVAAAALIMDRFPGAKATTQARQHLATALDAFNRLGAWPWAARAGHELRATGLSLGQAYTAGPASLTPQQREIARLAAAGLTNKQIGEQLFLSPRTIATHL